jgi:hypothetical protein
MKHATFSEEQIACGLRQARSGTPAEARRLAEVHCKFAAWHLLNESSGNSPTPAAS